MLKDCKSRIIDRPLSDFRKVSEAEFLALTWCHTIPALKLLTRNYAALNMQSLIFHHHLNPHWLEEAAPIDIGYLFRSFKYGFRRNVAPEDREEQTSDQVGIVFDDTYFNSLEPMTQPEIKTLLETNLVNYPGRVVNGSHRAFAMAGHLLRGGKYTPFYSMDLT